MIAPLKKMLATQVAAAAADRVAALDWTKLHEQLDGFGNAVIEGMLTPDECRAVSSLYPDDRQFRSHVRMVRHGFGKGEYKYFKYPLPHLVAGLRTALYPRLATVANAWNERMGVEWLYPIEHADFLKQCHEAGQTRPTPLLLQYVPGDFNCLHQDLYGDLAFPLQMVILLSEPGKDFTGGEFVLTEQRPRMQSRAEVVPLRQGDAVVFAVHNGRSRAPKETIGSTCGTASAGYGPAIATPSASSSTTRNEGLDSGCGGANLCDRMILGTVDVGKAQAWRNRIGTR
jgi:hypothetical protein